MEGQGLLGWACGPGALADYADCVLWRVGVSWLGWLGGEGDWGSGTRAVLSARAGRVSSTVVELRVLGLVGRGLLGVSLGRLRGVWRGR